MSHFDQSSPIGSADFSTVTKKESATEIVINKIKELLLTKALKPGDMLPSETNLSNAMNVSRGSVREAMKVLSAFGVIEIKQGTGTYISQSVKKDCFNPLLFSLLCTESNTESLKELREIFEIGIVKLIIAHGTQQDISALRTIVDEMGGVIASGNFDEELIFQHELVFHHALGVATHNSLVEHMYDFLLEFFRPQIKQSSSKFKTAAGKNTLKIHKSIVEALEECNLRKAERAISSSIKTWGESC